MGTTAWQEEINSIPFFLELDRCGGSLAMLHRSTQNLLFREVVDLRTGPSMHVRIPLDQESPAGG